jgi:hypothetical protein
MRTVLTAIAVLAAVVLTGCATTTDAGNAAPAAPAPAAPAATTHAAAAAPAAADGSAAHPFTYGATHHGKSLDVTVSAPKRFTPSENAFTTGSGSAYEVTITIADHANQAFSPLGELIVSATAGNAEAGDIEDTDQNIGQPEANVLPGHSLSWKQGFQVATGAHDLTLTVGTIAGDGSLYYSGPLR